MSSAQSISREHTPLPRRAGRADALTLGPAAALGAGFLALAAALTCLESRPGRPAASGTPGPEAAQVAPISSDAPRETADASVQALPAALAPLAVLVDSDPPSAADWSRAKISQEWVWPKRLTPLRSLLAAGHYSAAGNTANDNRSPRLAGWSPDQPEANQVRYEVDGNAGLFNQALGGFVAYKDQPERRIVSSAPLAQGRGAAAPMAAPVNGARAKESAAGARAWEAELKKIRADELTNMQKSNGAVRAQDVTKDDGPEMAKLTYAGGRTETVPYDPLVFDLKGGGVKTDARKVLFDLYGYGKADKLQWMNDVDDGTGILVFDATGSGRSGKNGSEVFGDRTDLTGVGRPDGFANGFEALRALVQKAAAEKILTQEVADGGVLDAGALAALDKAYGLRLKVGGFNHATVSLAEAGVEAIALSSAKTRSIANFDGRANSLVVQPGAVFKRRDGTTGYYMNIWLQAKDGNPGLD